MKIGYKFALTGTIGLLFSIFMPAQEIPKLPIDESVVRGVLPNGMKYFVIENAAHKGMADFALVNRADHNVTYKSDVWISISESVTDSTLLNLMKIADSASPADHAVIVAGDVDASAVKEKIKMLSYMTPVRDTVPVPSYVWKTDDDFTVLVEESEERNLAAVTAEWRAPRTPSDLMNTIQPAISSLFVGQMGIIAEDRLERSFRKAGIPVTGVGYTHLESSMVPGDETFAVTLSVGPENVDQAVSILASVMSSIDSGNVTAQEVNRAHDRYLEKMYASSANPLRSNAEFVNRCMSAFLYNGSLASQAQVYDFHTSRFLPDETELTLFNNIASAVLDKKSNLTLRLESPQRVDSEKVAEVFIASWEGAGTERAREDGVVAASFLKPYEPEKKMKMSLSRKDSMSGGSAFTLDNGLNVICIKHPADNRFHFSLELNGGYGDVRDLSAGEGAWFSDYLHTCRVSGIHMKDFLAALEEKGVRMDFEVGMSSMSISGSASKHELLTVIQALTLLTGSLEEDEAELEYYLRTLPLELESLKGTRQARMAAIDGILCPGYICSDMKSDLPGKDFGRKAWNLHEGQFSNLDDGILVFAGDVDEAELRRHLAIYGHRFRTLGHPSQRPDFRYHPISGVSVCTVKGNQDIIDYAMSARCTLTSDSHVAAEAASMTVGQRLSEAFEDSGWTADVRSEFTVQPDERFNLVVTLMKTGEEGLRHPEAMQLLRETITEMASKPLEKKYIDVCAAYLKHRRSLIDDTPSFWTEAVAGRKVFGKDTITGYYEKCDALTPQKVQNMISLLEKGGKVEYMTIKE